MLQGCCFGLVDVFMVVVLVGLVCVVGCFSLFVVVWSCFGFGCALLGFWW